MAAAFKLLSLLAVVTCISATTEPDAPRLLGIYCQDKAVNVHWEPKGRNRSVVSYAIEYNTTFTPDTWVRATENLPAYAWMCTVQLSPWGNYSLRVRAFDGRLYSAPSDHSPVCTTQPDVPYKNPDKVEGNGRAPNNIVISWKTMPQIEHNGPGFYYRVSYKPDTDAAEWTHVEVKDWRQSELLVSNTPVFMPFKIKVVAWNAKGPSNETPVQVVGWSGEGKPLLAPTNFTLIEVISANEAMFSWNPVPPDSVRGRIKSYLIQAWVHTEEDQVREVEVKPDATNVLLNILKPYKRNGVRIMVCNFFDCGPPSNTRYLVTPEGKPGPVASLDGYAFCSTAVLLTWEKPMDTNGLLTGYKVYYAKTVGTQVEPWVERKNVIDSKFDRAKLAGLQPDTKYRIELRAMTKAGEGPGVSVYVTTRSHFVGQPDEPRFEAYMLPPLSHDAHMLVRWELGSYYQPGTHFQAVYMLKGIHWQEWPMETDEDYVIIKGLESNRLYWVKVTAYIGEYHAESAARLINTTYVPYDIEIVPATSNVVASSTAELQCVSRNNPGFATRLTWIQSIQSQTFFSGLQIGSSAILLTWDKPTEYVLTDYKVFYAKTVGSALEPWVEHKTTIDSKSVCAKLTGLQPSTEYLIELRAKIERGPNVSSLVRQTTRSEYKKTERSPAVHMLTRWRPAVDGQPGTYFQTSYRMMSQDEPQWEQWQMEVEDDYVVVKGVAPNWDFIYCH